MLTPRYIYKPKFLGNYSWKVLGMSKSIRVGDNKLIEIGRHLTDQKGPLQERTCRLHTTFCDLNIVW